MIVAKSRLACSLPALVPDELEMAVEAWAEILHDMDIAWMNKCYVKAIQFHRKNDSGGPFGASDIYKVWLDVQAAGDYERWRVEQHKFLSEGNGEAVPPTEEFLDAMQEFLAKHRMPGTVGRKSRGKR